MLSTREKVLYFTVQKEIENLYSYISIAAVQLLIFQYLKKTLASNTLV